MRFGVLGPLLVEDANGPVVLASHKQRALLAILLLESPHGLVPTERLIDELWGERPPPTAGKALHVHLSQLRRALGHEQPIVTLPTGYALHIDRSDLDLHRFDALVSRARRLRTAGDLSGALHALQEALGLWRGPALADVILLGRSANEASRLDGLCAVAREERIELELAHGGGAALVPELEALIAADSYREHMHALLMLALYRAGRQADALGAFRRARRLLLDDLGLEPGPELERLQVAILNQDPELNRSPPVAPPVAVTQGPIQPAVAIPRAAASILGREAEVEAGLELIGRPEVRLVTLTGPGGIGKTRLALELADRLRERSHFVELAAITEPARVLPAIAAALGIDDATHAAIIAALSDEQAALFLDNFEQVVSAAPQLASLLSADSALTVVVTSRAALHIAGEHELPVPPLAPDSAVELFVRRARERDPGFSTGPEDLSCLAAICEAVDRLPLAIELAAARARVLEVREIHNRIGRRLELLTSGRRDAPERHRTLRATIDWSYDLLENVDKCLFAQLAAFRGGCSVESCEAIAAEPVLDGLSALVDHCLVLREGSRFGMLETVREYAAERLERLPDSEAVRHRHAVWFLTLARSAERELEGPEQSIWFSRLDAERENLRAAAEWAVANDMPEIALELDGALVRFWLARGAGAEVRRELSMALASGRGSPYVRAKALNTLGVLSGEAGDLAAARSAFEDALELADQMGDRRQMARTLMNLGVIAVYTEEYETALSRYSAAGEIWLELGDLRGRSVMYQNLAVVRELMGQLEEALQLLEQSVDLAREAGDGMHMARTLIELGRSLVQCEPSDARAPALLREGLELSRALGEQRQVIEGLEVLAALSARTGSPITGAELIGTVEAERARADVERKPDEVSFFEASIRELERALGREAYERARERGRGRSLEVAIAVALESTTRVPGPARSKQTAARQGRGLVRSG